MNSRFFNMTPEIQQRVAIVVPIIALLLSVFVVWPGWTAYQEQAAKVEAQRTEYNDLVKLPLPKPSPKIATVVLTPSEPPKSVGELSKIAEAAGCKVTGFDLGTVVSAKAAAEEAKQGGLVRPKRSRLNLVAHYQQIREFLAQLQHSPRVFVVTELNLTVQTIIPGSPLKPEPGTLEANVEIERYVTVPELKTTPLADVKKT